jgi:Tfp pilus assembly protein PilP
MLRRKTLRDDDFLENEDRNRDPFRSYMRLFIGKEGPRAPKVPAIFDKFALEELTLIGIVSGDAIPRAMFRDPGGLGQTIKRGDYISKAAARVTKILSDRVILELNEVAANGETRALERPILVNPEGAQK